jgi:hypothetical protein
MKSGASVPAERIAMTDLLREIDMALAIFM